MTSCLPSDSIGTGRAAPPRGPFPFDRRRWPDELFYSRDIAGGLCSGKGRIAGRRRRRIAESQARNHRPRTNRRPSVTISETMRGDGPAGNVGRCCAHRSDGGLAQRQSTKPGRGGKVAHFPDRRAFARIFQAPPGTLPNIRFPFAQRCQRCHRCQRCQRCLRCRSSVGRGAAEGGFEPFER